MTWRERRIEEDGTYIEERDNTMKLADFEVRSGSIQVHDMINGSRPSSKAVRFIRRFYTVEGGRHTPKGEPAAGAEAEFHLYVQPAHDLPRRVGQALIHAGRLCGAPPPR
jgi:hypothetical protein